MPPSRQPAGLVVSRLHEVLFFADVFALTLSHGFLANFDDLINSSIDIEFRIELT